MRYLRLKRIIDILFSSLGLLVLAPLFIVLIFAIKLDSPGPVFFKQKRFGIHKCHFYILKFRTMRVDTPKDKPTHLLENPEQWITKVGKFLRKTSLDELPQIINILRGEMSIVGPRPALWNQYDLIDERDKYGANDVPVGLTGWAQINGRDELEIDMKAQLDGEYVKNMSLKMDVKCFIGTIFSVLRSDGVVEGGTGIKNSQSEHIETPMPSLIDKDEISSEIKKVLITGKNSYIGTSFENWLMREPDKYRVDTIDMKDELWESKDFSIYDVVFHVAGIAHVSSDPKMEDFYYKVNRDLTIETAEKAKADGVKQFIFMSSIIVYGDSSNHKRIIDRDTIPTPSNFYGDSKLQAEKRIKHLESDDFKIVVIRPPMIYGKGSKGNYPRLANMAKKIPLFPDIENERSMLHIDNLCEFIKIMIDNEERGLFFPQNREYMKTSDLVKMIGQIHGKKIWMTKLFNPVLRMMFGVGIVNKVFGNLVYEKSMSTYPIANYQIRSFRESIELTESKV